MWEWKAWQIVKGLANGQLCSDISINLHGEPSRWAVLQQGNPESKRKAVDWLLGLYFNRYETKLRHKKLSVVLNWMMQADIW